MLPKLLIKNAQSEILKSLTMSEDSLSIGRQPGCRIVLPTPDVSRDHGAFTHSAASGVLSVEDHHSTNGIFVNGLQVRRTVLYTGDVVRIGLYKILISQGSSGTRSMAAIAKLA